MDNIPPPAPPHFIGPVYRPAVRPFGVSGWGLSMNGPRGSQSHPQPPPVLHTSSVEVPKCRRLLRPGITFVLRGPSETPKYLRALPRDGGGPLFLWVARLLLACDTLISAAAKARPVCPDDGLAVLAWLRKIEVWVGWQTRAPTRLYEPLRRRVRYVSVLAYAGHQKGASTRSSSITGPTVDRILRARSRWSRAKSL